MGSGSQLIIPPASKLASGFTAANRHALRAPANFKNIRNPLIFSAKNGFTHVFGGIRSCPLLQASLRREPDFDPLSYIFPTNLSFNIAKHSLTQKCTNRTGSDFAEMPLTLGRPTWRAIPLARSSWKLLVRIPTRITISSSGGRRYPDSAMAARECRTADPLTLCNQHFAVYHIFVSAAG